ncbi:MAG: hypothetical protein WAW96_10565 [Alphaproteobacteria bacterium]
MAESLRRATTAKAVLALLVAIAADGAQLFLNTPIALFFGIGAEAADIAIDIVTAILVIALVGYSPLLLPTFILEAVPLADVFPTWTACVVFLIWKRSGPSVTPSRS